MRGGFLEENCAIVMYAGCVNYKIGLTVLPERWAGIALALTDRRAYGYFHAPREPDIAVGPWVTAGLASSRTRQG
jgi:hypothetical protein